MINFPRCFKSGLPPPGWDEDWLIIPIDDPELGTSSVEAAPDYETPEDTSAATVAPPGAPGIDLSSAAPDLGPEATFVLMRID